MAENRGELHTVSWRDCCCWLILFRTFSLAVSVQVLLLASLALVAASAGWSLSHLVFLGPEELAKDAGLSATVKRLDRLPGSRPWSAKQKAGAGDVDASPAEAQPGRAETDGRESGGVLGCPYLERPLMVFSPILEPAQYLFCPARSAHHEWSLRKVAYFLAGGLWTLLVWAFFGAGITRTAAVRLTRDERVGFRESLAFAQNKLGSFFVAPLFPLFGVAGIGICLGILGLILACDVGVVLAGVLWCLVLLGGFLMALLLLGLLFGWPLMWATISTEGTDSFDALSRSYAYTFQRPLHYLFYVVVSVLFGALGWLLVWLFSEAVIALGDLTYAGAFLAAGADRAREVHNLAHGGDAAGASSLLTSGIWLIGFWIGCVRTVAAAFVWGFFWCSVTAIYLLLRRHVDEADLDEVYLEDEGREYGLPELATDDAGVPGVGDEPSADNDAGQDNPPEDRPSDLGG